MLIAEARMLRVGVSCAAIMVTMGLVYAAPATECFPCGPAGEGHPGHYVSGADGPVLEIEPGWNLYWYNPLNHWGGYCPYYLDHMGYPPTWYASVEFVPLFRDVKGGHLFATQPTLVEPVNGNGNGNGEENNNNNNNDPNGNDLLFLNTPVLSTRDFDTDFNSGARFLIGHQLGDWYRLEFSYLGFYTWADRATVRDPEGELTSPFTNFGEPDEFEGLDFNHFASINFRSRLHNGEVNLRRKLAIPTNAFNASFLIGGRYTRIDEQFGYRAESDLPAPMGAVNDVAVATTNNLIGVQIGLLGQFWERPRMWVDFEVKGAMSRNLASQNTLYTHIDEFGVPFVFAGQDQVERTSFTGDLSLAFNYHFTPSLTFRLGYQATWITGLALAADNFESDLTRLTLGPARVDHSGEAVYHGPLIGLTWVR